MAGDRGVNHLFCFGLGYTGLTLADSLVARGWRISGTVRSPEKAGALAGRGIEAFVYDGAAPAPTLRAALGRASHILCSIGAQEDGDPALRHHLADMRAAASCRWLGYLSTIGVYGDRGGAWVDENDAPDRDEPRARRRLAAEAQWLGLAMPERPVSVFRLGGIYGPGRNVLRQMREGTARRIVKPGQVFNRIHVADIAGAVASTFEAGPGGLFNIVDDRPSAPEEPVLEAARLLGLPPPEPVDFERAELSPMARAFYSANRRVANARIKAATGWRPLYPTYREGLAALFAEGEGEDQDMPAASAAARRSNARSRGVDRR